MRAKLLVYIDIEDVLPESENWIADTIALGNTICERLEEVDEVTVHDFDVKIISE